MVNTKSRSQMPLHGQFPENSSLQNQEQQRPQQPEDVPNYDVVHVSNESDTASSPSLAATAQNAIVPPVQQQVPLPQVPIIDPDACLMQATLNSIVRRTEEWEHRNNLQRQKDIRIMQEYMDHCNASLRREGIQRMRLVEEWEHRNSLQRQKDIRIMQKYMDRCNASLWRERIQRMRLVEEQERLGKIENMVRNKNRNESNSIRVNASGSLQVNAEGLVRIDAGETEQVKSSIKKEEPLEIICEICAETKRITEMIKNQTCHHSYCFDCMTKHVAVKIQDIITAVPCPGLDCKSVFELEACRPWLPKDLTERWDKALCEALFLQVPKFYCPFKDCSAMMLVENEEDQQAGETECPVCHRMFCPRCNIPWHIGVNCKKYQKLNENERQREDLLMRKLAKEKRWRRCPKCKFYVEKISGCVHITCRCKYEFCYECGQQWRFPFTDHVSCVRD